MGLLWGGFGYLLPLRFVGMLNKGALLDNFFFISGPLTPDRDREIRMKTSFRGAVRQTEHLPGGPPTKVRGYLFGYSVIQRDREKRF